jgi:hypothetical protein
MGTYDRLKGLACDAIPINRTDGESRGRGIYQATNVSAPKHAIGRLLVAYLIISEFYIAYMAEQSSGSNSVNNISSYDAFIPKQRTGVENSDIPS